MGFKRGCRSPTSPKVHMVGVRQLRQGDAGILCAVVDGMAKSACQAANEDATLLLAVSTSFVSSSVIFRLS